MHLSILHICVCEQCYPQSNHTAPPVVGSHRFCITVHGTTEHLRRFTSLLASDTLPIDYETDLLQDHQEASSRYFLKRAYSQQTRSSCKFHSSLGRFLFEDSVSCSQGWLRTCSSPVSTLKHWVYRSAPPHLVYVVSVGGLKPGLCECWRSSTNWVIVERFLGPNFSWSTLTTLVIFCFSTMTGSS